MLGSGQAPAMAITLLWHRMSALVNARQLTGLILMAQEHKEVILKLETLANGLASVLKKTEYASIIMYDVYVDLKTHL